MSNHFAAGYGVAILFLLKKKLFVIVAEHSKARADF
jgi:hypothetical protein